ncbi:MAG: hypothetical protein AM326_00960 [Candidatus Thorarchaeota archaeon SMTZ-45]|nr:MAG: hypothetical protein AM326_00960 [Candidatus Thorarchaeota archaeon SMTZ-45]
MLERILPDQVNNEFWGYKSSSVAFLVIAIISAARSLIHMFSPDGGAESIATIDLNVEGANIIVAMFALWSLSQLLMAVFYFLGYFRYQSLIPLMYIFIIIEYAARIGVGLFKPIETMGTAPGAISNFILVPLAILLFIFSIREPESQTQH